MSKGQPVFWRQASNAPSVRPARILGVPAPASFGGNLPKQTPSGGFAIYVVEWFAGRMDFCYVQTK